MKAVILAGGLGTRIAEETGIKPKPMVEVGGYPILWHIMKGYSHHGITDFVICAGYKGYTIKEYFANYFLHRADVTFELRTNSMLFHRSDAEPWRVTIADTGDDTMTGGRILRAKEHIGGGTFCLTYGDGVSDVNIAELIKFHKESSAVCTLTAVQQPGRFGAFTLEADETRIETFREKPEGDGAWINGGFFVVDSKAFDYIEGDETVWERYPIETMAERGELHAFRHSGFWQPMDTLRDKMLLESLWTTDPPWKVWR
jgi:glucose-1-phosphate cytidylyltransferase